MKEAIESWRKREQRLKNRLNLFGEMRISGRKVKDNSRKIPLIIKNTPNKK